jgi:peptidase E
MRKSPIRTTLMVGILFLSGGEAFCLLGPIRYEHLVHIVCHVVFYAGFALVCLGVGMWLAGKRGRTGNGHHEGS